MHQKDGSTEEEQLQQYRQLKDELLQRYKGLKKKLEYASDDVEEGLVREKREKLARQIKALSAKIAETETKESLA